MILIVFFICVFVCVGMGIWASVSDLRGLTIPNFVSLLVLLSFFLAYGVMAITNKEHLVFSSFLSHFGAGVLVFVLTYILFALRLIGAADSKLASSYAFWLGYKGLLPFVFYMSLVGGGVALVALFIKKVRPFKHAGEGSWLHTLQYKDGRLNMPYGVAIAAGALISFVILGYFDSALLYGTGIWE